MLQTFSTFYNADDLAASKGQINSKVHYPKRAFPADLDMHAKRNHNVVGGYEQNATRFVTFYSRDHSNDVFKANRKNNPETIFDSMAKQSRRKFSHARLSGQHEAPPFHMKGIDEAKHIPDTSTVMALNIRKCGFATPTKSSGAPLITSSKGLGDDDYKDQSAKPRK